MNTGTMPSPGAVAVPGIAGEASCDENTIVIGGSVAPQEHEDLEDSPALAAAWVIPEPGAAAKPMMRWIFIAFVCVVLIGGIVGPVIALVVVGNKDDKGVCIDLFQLGDWLGTVKPVSTAQDVVAFYQYKESNGSYNGDNAVPTVPNGSLIFVHENAENCELSLVIVHDSTIDETGGKAQMVLSGDFSNPTVADEPQEYVGPGKDTYIYDDENKETTISWEWLNSYHRTDGMAQRLVFEVGDSVTVTPTLWDGIISWQYVSGPHEMLPDNANIYMHLNMNKTLTIKRVDCN